MAADPRNLKERLFGAEENSAAALGQEKLGEYQELAERIYRTPQLSAGNILVMALAKAGNQLGNKVYSNYADYFFNNVLRIDIMYVVLIKGIISIYDVLNNPLMGIAYDKTRTRWGKGRPYVFLSPLFFFSSNAVIFLGGMLFANNDNTAAPQKILFLFITLFLRETFETIYKIPTDNYITLISPNPEDRQALILWQTFADKWTGDFICGMIMPLLNIAQYGIGGITSANVFAVFGVLSAVLGTTGTMMTAAQCRERIVLQPKPAATTKALFYFLKNKYAVREFAADFLGSWWGSSFGWDVTSQLEVFGGVLRGAIAMMPRQVMQFVSIHLTGRFRKMFGGSYRKTILFMRIWDQIFTFAPALIVWKFPRQSIGKWWKACLLYAVFDMLRVSNDAPSTVLENEISREIQDYTEYVTGERPDGTIGILLGLVGKVMAPVSTLMNYRLMKWTGYDPQIGKDKPWRQDTVNAHISMYSKVLIMYLIGDPGTVKGVLKNFVYLFYDLDGKKKEEMYAALNERRALIAKTNEASDEIKAMVQMMAENQQ